MKNSQLKAFQALCDSIPSFTGNRIDKNMLLIEAEELKLCFFVNNVGEQLKNPRTNTFEVDSPAL